MRHPPACSNQAASEHLRRLPHPLPTLVLPRSPSISTSTRASVRTGEGGSGKCLTASHFDPEPMRGSLAGMPAGISGGQRTTNARSCLTIRAMPWPHAMNSAIYPAQRSRHQHRARVRRPICGAVAQHVPPQSI
jgi:hypothetical protein